MLSPIFFFIFAPSILTGTLGVNLIFVSMHSYTSLPYSLDYVGPAIDIGIRDANSRFHPNINFTQVSWNKTNLRTCGDVQTEVVPFVSNFCLGKSGKRSIYDVVVILAPGKNSCPPQQKLLT